MQKFIEPLQFITHDIQGSSHIQQVQKACEAGCKWIQYRCLTKTDEGLLSDINEIAVICDDWGTTLIVTDHIHLAGEADIQGFHMEDPAADLVAARAKLGESFTIGGTALNEAGLIAVASAGADYAGFGPFAITATKPNSYPLITLSGYAAACKKLKELQLAMPVIAVAGITEHDAEKLMTTGIYGIAISSVLNSASDFSEAYSTFKGAMSN